MKHHSALDQQAEKLTQSMDLVFETMMAGSQHPYPDLPLTPREVGVLTRLATHGETPMTELAAATGLPLSTLTRLADRLEYKGLVTRRRSPDDRRSVRLRNSSKAMRVYQAMHDHRLAMNRQLLTLLDEPEQQQFLDLLTKMAQQLRAQAPR